MGLSSNSYLTPNEGEVIDLDEVDDEDYKSCGDDGDGLMLNLDDDDAIGLHCVV
jgi:hypothetical protein